MFMLVHMYLGLITRRFQNYMYRKLSYDIVILSSVINRQNIKTSIAQLIMLH